MYDRAGSLAHESFVFNAALGRLDMYNFDIWNMNQCQCKVPQPGMKLCARGFPRWSINAFAFTRNVSQQYPFRIPNFDEPDVSMGWPEWIAPHRVAIVGETLFVHSQVSVSLSAGMPVCVVSIMLSVHGNSVVCGCGSCVGNAVLRVL